MNITMIGTGYVGLVSGTCFADLGFSVTCVDKLQEKITSLKEGEIPIYEPGLEEIVNQNIKEGRLFFSTDLKEAVSKSDVIFIAVGTPTRKEDGSADLQYIYSATKEIAEALTDKYTVIVTKSTVPVGTGRKIFQLIKEINPRANFDIVSNPEFLREGSALNDFMQPDRIVIGCETERSKEVMENIYKRLSSQGIPVVYTNIETAELIKYASNTFLAMKVTFINEISDLCEKCGANIKKVSEGIGLDKRIGNKFLQAGPGYGGSCFPKDTKALVHISKEYGSPIRLAETIVDINEKRKKNMAERIIYACGGNVSGKTICILGITFKPNTDDMRNSPSIDIIPILINKGAHIKVYDPKGKKEGEKIFPDIEWCNNSIEAISSADALVILTEWNEFSSLTPEVFKENMRGNIIIDLRNIFEPSKIERAGFKYYSIGR